MARAILQRGLQSENRPGGVVIEGGAQIGDGVTFGGSNDVGMFSFVNQTEIGFGTTIGVHSVLVGPITIGEFCQIAPHVLVVGGDHPLTRFSTYTGKLLLGRGLDPYMERPGVRVGHGVWVGPGALVLAGTTIGNGAVVAAGAVVRGDVPPYTIAAGNPATIVAQRLDPELAALVDETRWWAQRGADQEVLRQLASIDFAAAPGAARAELERVVQTLRAGEVA